MHKIVCFSEWQTHLSTSLQLTAVEVDDIEKAWPRDPAMQRVKMFRRWKSNFMIIAGHIQVARYCVNY
jgi:hypothetical protein